MTMEPGGRAEKLGNDYERLWGAHALLSILDGEATSVLSEPLGEDEPGVDFWVRRPDGTRHCQQCKRENGDTGRWSIADLHRVGVLKHAQSQLARDPSHRFEFVSSDSAPQFEDLSERTGRCNGDPSQFVQHLTTTSAPLRESFGDLCRYLGWNPNKPDDVARVFDFLSRVERFNLPRGRQGRVHVERLARRLIRGKPAQVVSDLENLLITRGIGNELLAGDVRQWLKERGHTLLDLGGDAEVHAGVERLQQRFLRSVGAMLIDASLIERAESRTLVETLTRADKPVRLALLHGRAGTGKSGVLLEVARILADLRLPHLFLRLDTQCPRVSTDRFGSDVLGLPASPVTCLGFVSGGKPAVLVLDQVDAIRWTSSHSADAWDVCEELIEEAFATPNVRVVLVCRSFDLNDDPRIAAWKARDGTLALEVAQLPESEAKRVVERAGGSWDALSTAQRHLLRTPQSLYLWWTLVRDGLDMSGVTRITDLLRAFWKNRRGRLADMGVPIDSQQRLLAAVIGFMDSNGELSAPASVAGPLARELDAFKTLDLIRDDGKRIAFAHQSHLDFLIAESLLQRGLERPASVLEWVVGRSQALFRRPRLQQLLMLLREDDPGTFATITRELVDRSDVRFHFKVLALRVLGAIRSPTRAEVALALDLLQRSDWHDHIFELVVARSADWVRALHEAGVLVEWLRSGPDERRNRAAWLLRSVNGQVGDIICNVAARVDVAIRDRWLPGVLPYDGLSDTVDVFALRVTLISAGMAGLVDLIAWPKLADAFPERAIRLVHAYVTAILHVELTAEAAHHQRQVLMRGEGPALQAAARRAPSMTLELLWPLCEELALRANRAWQEDRTALDRAMQDLATDTLDLLIPIAEAAAAEMARSQPDRFLEFLGTRGLHPVDALRLPLVRAAAALPTTCSDQALTWLLSDPARLLLEEGQAVPPACEALRAHSVTCSEAVFECVQDVLLKHVDPDERSTLGYLLRGHYNGRNEYGRVQLALLRALPRDRLNPAASARLQLWEAKFLDAPPPPPTDWSSGGRIVSPIPAQHLLRVSDDEWLSMGREWTNPMYRQLDANRAIRTSVRQFTGDLMEATHTQPDRFGRLARRIPAQAAPEYLNAILHGLERRNPPERLAEPEKQAWSCASHEVLEGVLELIGYCEDRRRADLYVGIVEAHATLPWSGHVLATIVRYAREHPSPIAGEEHPDAFPRPETFRQLSSLGTRGRAAGAIRQLIARDVERRHALASTPCSVIRRLS